MNFANPQLELERCIFGAIFVEPGWDWCRGPSVFPLFSRICLS